MSFLSNILGMAETAVGGPTGDTVTAEVGKAILKGSALSLITMFRDSYEITGVKKAVLFDAITLDISFEDDDIIDTFVKSIRKTIPDLKCKLGEENFNKVMVEYGITDISIVPEDRGETRVCVIKLFTTDTEKLSGVIDRASEYTKGMIEDE